jgi:hypothetical protein
LPDLCFTDAPPREELLRQLRGRLAETAPGVRLIAESVLGAEAPIDFVGVEASGRVTAFLVGEAGQDLELVARALAQRAWLALRLRDWVQLAPDLGLRPEAGLRIVLLCPEFRPASRAAAAALGKQAPELAAYRCVRRGGASEVLVERLAGERPPAPAPETGAPEPPRFRTGLTEADLGLSAAERREFESL